MIAGTALQTDMNPVRRASPLVPLLISQICLQMDGAKEVKVRVLPGGEATRHIQCLLLACTEST